jgi:hypothetical protein
LALPESTLRALPAGLAATVTDWVARLAATLGETLVGAAFYGGLARGEYVPDRSDVNLALVLREAGPAVLDRIEPLVSEGARGWHLAPWLLTERDLQRSADVFPTKFLDLQHHHLMLCGRDVFAELTVPREHLRLRCEQELTNLHLRLRHRYLRARARPELLETTLLRSLPGLRVNVGLLVELKTGRRPAGWPDIGAAGRALGLDLGVVERMQAVRAGQGRLEPEQWRDWYAAFMRTVEQAVALADQSTP